jgi:hypothetical protein
VRASNLMLALVVALGGLAAAASGAGCNTTVVPCSGQSCDCAHGTMCSYGGCTDQCQLTCEEQSNCDAHLGTGSTATCTGATCAITVGDGSTVDCKTGAICNVACTGTCMVDCREAGQCFLSCGGAHPTGLTGQGQCP